MLKKFNNWILQIKWKQNWPVCTLVACTHWDEIIWYKIFEYLLNDFNIEQHLNKWTLNLVIWNLQWCIKWKKYIDTDFNRIWDFKKENKNTYEYKRANEIKDILVNSDYVFDLHSTTNPSPFFLIPWNKVDSKILKWFNADFIIKDILDFLHWKPLVKWVYENNPNSQTLVMEGYLENEKDVKKAINNVLYYLWYYWLIDYNNSNKYNPTILKTIKALYAKSMNIEFIYSKNPKSFQKIKKWEVILKDDWKDVISDDDYYILMPTKPRYIWEEIWYLVKEEKN